MANLKKVRVQLLNPETNEVVEEVNVLTSADSVTFADGETFQQKLDAGKLKGQTGNTGATGATGAKGADGATGCLERRHQQLPQVKMATAISIQPRMISTKKLLGHGQNKETLRVRLEQQDKQALLELQVRRAQLARQEQRVQMVRRGTLAPA